MDAPDTVTEAVRQLRIAGYRANFQLIDGAIRCEGRSGSCGVDEMVVEHLFRFEGESDPGDEMVVFGLYEPATDTRGALASAFGSAADPALLEHVVGLADRHRSGSLTAPPDQAPNRP